MENGNKKSTKLVENKKLVIIAILLLIFFVLLSIGFALFSDIKSEESNLRIGEIEVVLVEDWPKEIGEPSSDDSTEVYDEYGIEKYSKTVSGKSVAELDSYVRIRCIPIVQYYEEETEGEEGKWITTSIPQKDIKVTIDSEDWVEDGDYWYYKNILKGYEQTTDLNIDWIILDMPSELASKKIRTDVKVILEYAQTTNNMWKNIFQIEDLPIEVEKVQE